MKTKFKFTSHKQYKGNSLEPASTSTFASTTFLPAFSILEFEPEQYVELSLAPMSITGDYDTGFNEPLYNMAWDTFEDMILWLRDLQEQEVVKLWRTHRKISINGKWTEKQFYSCTRNGTGGGKPYNQLHPEWGRKVPMKQTGCKCHLMVKLYPGTSHVLGKYTTEHSHPVCGVNVRFTCLSEAPKDQILEMLHMGINHDKIVSNDFLSYSEKSRLIDCVSFLRYKEIAMEGFMVLQTRLM